LLVVLVGLLLTVGWWFFFISPRNGEIADARDELEAAQAQEQRLRVQIVQLREIEDDEILYLDAISHLESLIPERPLLDEFIEDLDELAGNTSVDLQSMAPSVPEQRLDSELRVVNVPVQVGGEFFDVLGFLFGLNDMERLVRVDGLSLNSAVDDDGGTILSVNLDLRLFTLADLLPTPEELIPPGAEEGGADEASDEPGTEAVGTGIGASSVLGGG
jgi:Tfp pilus assembly protein PilO